MLVVAGEVIAHGQIKASQVKNWLEHIFDVVM